MTVPSAPGTRVDVGAAVTPAGATGAGRACTRAKALALAMLVVSVVAVTPRAARSGETIVTLEPFEPLNSVWMLSAPHVGRRTCEVAAATRARFLARANHGPHPYAQVEVLEGACAGRRGYVPWSNIEPQPAADSAP